MTDPKPVRQLGTCEVGYPSHSRPHTLALSCFNWKPVATDPLSQPVKPYSRKVTYTEVEVEAHPGQDERTERHKAEAAYTIAAFDYQRDPVGSRDWELFWKGWRARSSPPESTEIAPHSSVVYSDLKIRCHECDQAVIWRYLDDDDKDEIEILHECVGAEPATGIKYGWAELWDAAQKLKEVLDRKMAGIKSKEGQDVMEPSVTADGRVRDGGIFPGSNRAGVDTSKGELGGAPLEGSAESILNGLRYIANSPTHEHGGFHPEAVKTAKAAIEWIQGASSSNAALRKFATDGFNLNVQLQSQHREDVGRMIEEKRELRLERDRFEQLHIQNGVAAIEMGGRLKAAEVKVAELQQRIDNDHRDETIKALCESNTQNWKRAEAAECNAALEQELGIERIRKEEWRKLREAAESKLSALEGQLREAYSELEAPKGSMYANRIEHYKKRALTSEVKVAELQQELADYHLADKETQATVAKLEDDYEKLRAERDRLREALKYVQLEKDVFRLRALSVDSLHGFILSKEDLEFIAAQWAALADPGKG